MPPEVIILILVIFSFVTLMVWMGFKHDREKQRAELEGQGSSLRTSELKNLMREAVEEANAPLLARIETLETQQRALLEGASPEEARPLLEIPDPDAFEVEAAPARRTRTR